MNTTSVRQMGYRRATLWAALLLCLSGPACFRAPDMSKIPCVAPSNCPNNFHCVISQGAKQGVCAPGPASAADGSSADLTLSSELGGNGGGLGDGSLGRDANDSSLGGAGGTGGSTGDVPSGGSGGSVTPDGSSAAGGTTSPEDAPSATGGTTSPGDAPSATGGTTSTPDARVSSDAPDALGTLPNGSPCTVDGQCSNGLCVDGHCCDSKCDGNCESCVTGVCSFTSTPRKACSGTGKCVGICDKSNVKACTFDSTTVCAAQSCSAGVRANKSVCDGLGNCPAQTKTTCDNNQCTADLSDCATCTDEPLATTCAGGHCGPTTNNCGKTVQCSTTCSGTAQTCGGGGVAGMCGCTPASTTQTCGTHCGTLTNNCGLSVDCGGCTSPQTCGGGGTATVCGCTANCSGKCGGSDGCGGTCPNNCVAPQTCGGGGTANVCGCSDSSACTGHCGTLTNACWASVTCPGCTGVNTCGGGGTANVCGCSDSSACSSHCGTLTNSCGVSVTCPGCTGVNSCGGGGVPNVCGCTNSTCGGRVCGSVANVCGGTIPCGTCPSGQTCDATGHCLCKQKSGSNLLVNPGFDVSAGTSGWTLGAGAAFNSADVDGCSPSGSVLISALLDNIRQCVGIQPYTPYFVGFAYKGPANCWVTYYSGNTCVTANQIGSGPTLADYSPSGSWTRIDSNDITPANTGRLSIDCSGPTGSVYYDQLYINTSSSQF